jgi:hypothetical protein
VFDRKNIKLIAAALAWPVIPAMGWLGLYLFGAAGGIVGTFLGLFAYFFGIWKAIPKDK